MKNTTQPHAVILQKFSRLLPEKDLNRIAVETGFIQRRARKLTPFCFVVSFFMSCAHRLTSLSGWAQQLLSLCGRSLSKQGLDSRLTQRASGFAQRVLEQLLTRQRCVNREVRRAMQNFSSILAQDSTTFALKEGLKEVFRGNVSRGVEKAVLRLKAILELSSMQLVDLKVTCYRENDQSSASNIHRLVRCSALVLRDLGYWSVDSLQKITARGAYFLSRLRWGIKLYSPSGKELPLAALLRGKWVDRWVRLSCEHTLSVRLVIIPLAPEVAEQRVRKAKKDRDRRLHHSEEYYRFLAYDVLVTNVAGRLCTPSELQGLYSLRWQIEVLFRALKSGALNLQEMIRAVRKNAERVRTVVTLALCFVALALGQLYQPYQQRILDSVGRWLSLTRVLRWWMAHLAVFAAFSEEELQAGLVSCCYEKRKRLCLPQKLQRLT